MKKLLGIVWAALLLAATTVSVAQAACVIQTINYGETRNGTLASDDCVDHNINGYDYYYDYYEFTGTSGQQILITDTSSALDPDLMLIMPDGTYVYNDNGGGGTSARIPATSGFYTLTQTGKHHIIASSGLPLQTGAYAMTLSLNNPTPTSKPTIEFYNVYLKHYFVTAEQAEATAIDNGSAGAGWVRTGFSYDVYGTQVTAVTKALGLATVPVCRFYGTPGVGPNSHFYTADAAECDAVKKDPGWKYEGIAYYIQVPVNGSCPSGTQPIYRAYNNGFATNDSNHRFITNPTTYLSMAGRGWAQEGVVMCATGVRVPTPVTGGTFKDPGSGAGITVATGEIPASINATSPRTTPTTTLPPGMVNPGEGDVNVTKGSAGYDVNLTGDAGFTTANAGAVMLSMPFDATLIPAADQTNPIFVFIRLYDWEGGTMWDIEGTISLLGTTGTITAEMRGTPLSFTAVVIYNPDMDFVTSDQVVTEDGTPLEPFIPTTKSNSATVWPAQTWCSRYNTRSPDVIAAVKAVLGIATNPTRSQIKRVVQQKVTAPAAAAEAIYQTDGFAAPNMSPGNACGQPLKYYVHVQKIASQFVPDDPGASVNEKTGYHYGRLYIGADRMAISDAIGNSYGIIAHEMLHAVQNGYRLLGITPKSYREGNATIYGNTIQNGAITVRPEWTSLRLELLGPVGQNRYGSEDFWAYVGKQYNGGKLNYLSGLYAQMRTTLGANTIDPPRATLYGVVDSYFTATFAKGLVEIYLDFLKQRALTHNAASQFGRAGEVVNGLALDLFNNTPVNQAVDISNCAAAGKTTWSFNNWSPFASPAIVIKPTGALPAGNTTGVTVTAKVIPAAGAVGGQWRGWTYYKGADAALVETNKFSGFGKAATDEIDVLIANTDMAVNGSYQVEIGCGGVKIDSLSPNKGPTGTVVTINGSGFGVAADVRTVTFNGVAGTAVTYVNDTQLKATVPNNASTGDVFVTVNGEKSNGVNFEVIAQCSATQNAGGDVPDTRTVELGRPSGTFDFRYETFSQKDQIIVRYQGATIFDTGCVGANGTKTLSYNGASTSITVQVIPNCAGGSGTAWNYTVNCPK